MEYHLKFGVSNLNTSSSNHAFDPKFLLRSRKINLPHFTKSSFRHEIPYKAKQPFLSKLNIENIIDERHMHIHCENEEQFTKGTLSNTCSKLYPSVQKLKNIFTNNDGNDSEKTFYYTAKNEITINDFFDLYQKSQSQQRLLERRESKRKIEQSQQLIREMTKSGNTTRLPSRKGSTFSLVQSGYRSATATPTLAIPINLHLEPVTTLRNCLSEPNSPGKIKVVTLTQSRQGNPISMVSSNGFQNTGNNEALLSSNVDSRENREEELYLNNLYEKKNRRELIISNNIGDSQIVGHTGFSSFGSMKPNKEFENCGSEQEKIVGGDEINSGMFGFAVLDSGLEHKNENNYKNKDKQESKIIYKSDKTKQKHIRSQTSENQRSLLADKNNNMINNFVSPRIPKQSNIHKVNQYEIKYRKKEILNHLLKFNVTPQKLKINLIDNQREKQILSIFGSPKTLDQHFEASIRRGSIKNFSSDNIEIANDHSINYHSNHKKDLGNKTTLPSMLSGLDNKIGERVSIVESPLNNNSNLTNFAVSNSQSPLTRVSNMIESENDHRLGNKVDDASQQFNRNIISIDRFFKNSPTNSFTKSFNRLLDKRIHVHSQLKIGQRFKNLKDKKV